jgi:D-erythronate 2-dehydrogenase
MKILITGGAGFVGARLARTLLQRGLLDGRHITQLVLADQAPAPADLQAHPAVQTRVGPLLAHCEALATEAFDGVFHLASAVSGECELDFDLGLRSNLDSTRALLDALRARVNAGAAPTKLVFSSSVAVFGPDAAVPLPVVVADTTLPAPQTSYGAHKLICEHLVADYTRKGYLDGRAARLMTVTVRPGRPNGAASSFFSGIIREPLAGEKAVLPVAASVSHPVSSPRATVQGLIAVFEASREAFNGRLGMNLPALNVSVQAMLDALERVAGPAVRARVKAVPDARIAGIVANWPSGATAQRAA